MKNIIDKNVIFSILVIQLLILTDIVIINSRKLSSTMWNATFGLQAKMPVKPLSQVF
jgi:hypothetical protein